MNELDKMFATNPALLEAPEVKSLIAYCERHHKRNVALLQKRDQFFDNVLDLIVHSRLILKPEFAIPDAEIVEKIGELTNEY